MYIPIHRSLAKKKKITVQEFKMWQYTDGENCLALGITRKACGVITGIKEMKLSWNTMASDERKIWDSTWRNDLHHATYFSEQNKFDITKWKSLKWKEKKRKEKKRKEKKRKEKKRKGKEKKRKIKERKRKERKRKEK